jgi:hypothetical protein
MMSRKNGKTDTVAVQKRSLRARLRSWWTKDVESRAPFGRPANPKQFWFAFVAFLTISGGFAFYLVENAKMVDVLMLSRTVQQDQVFVAEDFMHAKVKPDFFAGYVEFKNMDKVVGLFAQTLLEDGSILAPAHVGESRRLSEGMGVAAHKFGKGKIPVEDIRVGDRVFLYIEDQPMEATVELVVPASEDPDGVSIDFLLKRDDAVFLSKYKGNVDFVIAGTSWKSPAPFDQTKIKDPTGIKGGNGQVGMNGPGGGNSEGSGNKPSGNNGNTERTNPAVPKTTTSVVETTPTTIK